MRTKPNLKSPRREQVEAKRQPQSWFHSPMTWVVALVLAAGTIAVLTTASARGREEGSPTPQIAFAETLGPPLPPYTSPDPAIGLQAPAVNAQTMQGDRVHLQGDGTARIYGFFAHWCPHCQAELPAAARWLDANPVPSGVEVVAISTAVDEGAANYPPTEWFIREEWPATVLLDDTETPLATGFGLTAFPFWVAVDADGIVVARSSGAISEAEFAALVDEVTPSR